MEHLQDERTVLVVEETGDVNKGIGTIGVQRRYTGTAGRIGVSVDEEGELVLRSTFSTKPASKQQLAIVRLAFDDPAFRKKALQTAKRALEYLRDNHPDSKEIKGLEGLIDELS